MISVFLHQDMKYTHHTYNFHSQCYTQTHIIIIFSTYEDLQDAAHYLSLFLTSLGQMVWKTSKGLVLYSEVYQGKTAPLPKTHLGLGPSVILRLVETLPVKSSIFFDQYFTTVSLLNSLLDWGLEWTGTMLHNRVTDVHPSQDSNMKRGDMEEFCRYDDKLVIVQWKDSKACFYQHQLWACVECEVMEQNWETVCDGSIS